MEKKDEVTSTGGNTNCDSGVNYGSKEVDCVSENSENGEIKTEEENCSIENQLIVEIPTISTISSSNEEINVENSTFHTQSSPTTFFDNMVNYLVPLLVPIVLNNVDLGIYF